MEIRELKNTIQQQLADSLQERAEFIEKQMAAAQDAANAEGKSSAGDKYETGRAMAHLERDKYARQLSELGKQQQALLRFSKGSASDQVEPGSLVITDKAILYIAIASGKLKVAGKDVMCISPLAPLAKQLLGKSAGDKAVVNGNAFLVVEIL